MLHSFHRLIVLAILMVGYCLPVIAEQATWVFEGLLTKVDSALAPNLQSGWVLSGSFQFDPLELQEEIPASSLRAGRLEGGITETELTVDLYYQLHFEASQVPGLAGFDYQENDPDKDGRDLLGWFIPMVGQLKESGWSSRWLQVWLADSEGKMLLSAPPRIPPGGFQWKSAWFRLMFVNEAGEEVFAEGRIEIFSPESEVEAIDPQNDLAAIISDLGAKLTERDSTISGLRQDLAAMQDRLSGLRSMVDLLVEERTHLQGEKARLEEQIKLVDPQAQEQLADITAEKALLEQQISDMTEKNETLALSLSESEVRRRKLMDRIAELEAASEPVVEADRPAQPTQQGSLKSSEGRDVGVITVYQQPTVIERPVSVALPPAATASSIDKSTEPAAPKSRRFGPRKFR